MADDACTFFAPHPAVLRDDDLLPLLDVACRRFADADLGSLEAEQSARTMLNTALFILVDVVGEAEALMTCAEMVTMRRQADRAATMQVGA